MLTKRRKELLELLATQDSFQTVAFLARQLGVSKRTIHSELKIIEDYIQSSGKYLEKKRGVGIALRELKENVLPQENDETTDLYSTVTRRIEIMKMLLFEESTISFNHLSEMFIVSKTSIIKDLEFIMKILKVGSNIELKSDIHGTRIAGNEIDTQKAYLQFNRYLLSNSDFYYEDTISKKMSLLEPYYGEKIITVCSNILYNYIRENINVISDYYVQNVLNIFIILVYRILNGNHIRKNKKTESSDYTLFFEESAVRLLHRAALRLEFSYTNEDVKYLSQHLISNRFETFPEQNIDNAIINRLLTQVSEALNIDFSNDKKLEEELKNHIPPMIYRLRSNNKNDNPFTSQIKTEFSLTFNVIWVVLSEYEKELGIAFNEDEIAFLTIYFQSAIERAKINRKILIVCQMGIATSELLMNRIKNVIPSLDTIEVASISELEHIDLNRFDLIVSTINIDLPGRNVIFVSPFLTERDVEKIRESGYKPSKINKINSVMTAHHLKKYTLPEFVYVDTDFSSREELFEKVGKDLVDKNFVSFDFVPSLIKREELGGTDLPFGVAVPHGNPMQVNHTVVAIVKNKKKFKWDTYYVDIVFLICISREDTLQTRRILSDIYNIVDDAQMLKQMREKSSKKALLET
ncbi:BglG family transcription antiterminator [Amphibacillus sp. Q70]|uniref:BglG family transcription antiterminator n=1 Tax=Amphibacillus sp. Q70 TaxID=3453416 RepID=UPI003F82DAF4